MWAGPMGGSALRDAQHCWALLPLHSRTDVHQSRPGTELGPNASCPDQLCDLISERGRLALLAVALSVYQMESWGRARCPQAKGIRMALVPSPPLTLVWEWLQIPAGQAVRDGEGSPSWRVVALEAGLGAETCHSFAACAVPGGRALCHAQPFSPGESSMEQQNGARVGARQTLADRVVLWGVTKLCLGLLTELTLPPPRCWEQGRDKPRST